MQEFENYRDLIIRREINKEVLDTYIELKNRLDKEILKGPSDLAPIELGSVRGNSNMTMEIYINQIEQINNQITAATDIVNKIDEKIERIENKINELEDLDYKVIYLRDIKGMTLEAIANRLGFSTRHIERISARNTRCRECVGDKLKI